ncbi:HIRAN domain-containing protein [Methanobrevibacter sp.]|uniref:HIRAN domain-containing protein n=1 Tax=Methanobrevibacter sp. TaxID=66852 RepID=UPI00386C8053
MDEWHVGDPEDWGDHVGVPDIGYMGYLRDDENADDGNHPHKSVSESLRMEAWRLRNDGRYDEALDKINEALNYSKNWRIYNVKAIILEDMGDYNRALLYYDKALSQTSSQLVRDNKARLLERMANAQQYSGNLQRPLEQINQALKLTGDDEDRCDFLRTKASILEKMKRPREAYVCIKLANRQFDKVDEYESQSEMLKNTSETIICIAGRQFHDHVSLSEGIILDLVKEPSNEHDADAIRIDYNGKTVGYVANSTYTLIDEASSASDIKNMFQDHAKAEILFLFMERHLVAKLIVQ